MSSNASRYHAAIAADEAFSKACTDAGFKSRWDAPPRYRMPAALAAAYDAKVAADRAALSDASGSMAAIARVEATQLKAAERGGMSSVRVAADGFHVATVSAGMNDQAAYARLFAAAPNLYQAIKPLAFSSPDNPPPGVHPNHWRDAVSAAREAMAKARGEA